MQKKAITNSCKIVKKALNNPNTAYTATNFPNISNANEYLVPLEKMGILELSYMGDHGTKFRKLADKRLALDFLARYERKPSLQDESRH